MPLGCYLSVFTQQSLEDVFSHYFSTFFERLMKTVEFAANVVQRWLPICALYVNTLQTWTRILITVKNVESVGELARKVISYFCVQDVFQVF